MSVSIVMPSYNEGEIIGTVIETYYRDVVSKIKNSEIIVVDGGSKDNSLEVLEKLRRKIPCLRILSVPGKSNHGKAIRMGYKAAGKEFIFQVDSDNQFDANDFWELYKFKDNYDFILGYRRERHDTFSRLILTKIVRVINLIIFGVWIKDANCPFRLIRKKVLKDFLKLIDKETLAPNIMISILAKKKVRMKEVPVTHYERKTGKVSIVSFKLIKFSLNGLRQLLKLRLNLS
ncbi:MAG: glycosyl transferase family 2 [Candidatus Nealsonbacteria bacterium CG02_land_8_20_14_3_00_40_11]|uniref:Glycosyl transferase family 2 n=1 Tax=Candidatus Nealsonbacteria bacterium CG02_land_8_20_14_3_00_40_11 TaxID=1974700 RepID=A0A2M7D7K2_9BACT|nr:MAG: glycosyl transferase family 2 [Candidatus Nealsonbacteria bacterium CG02_land_8_20_14_3_00_40_11]